MLLYLLVYLCIYLIWCMCHVGITIVTLSTAKGFLFLFLIFSPCSYVPGMEVTLSSRLKSLYGIYSKVCMSLLFNNSVRLVCFNLVNYYETTYGILLEELIMFIIFYLNALLQCSSKPRT